MSDRLGVTEGDPCPTCGASAGDSCRLPLGQNCLHPITVVHTDEPYPESHGDTEGDPRLGCWFDGRPSVALAPRHSGGDDDRPAHWVPVCQYHADHWHDETDAGERLPIIPRFGLALYADQARAIVGTLRYGLDNGLYEGGEDYETLTEGFDALEAGLRAYDDPNSDTAPDGPTPVTWSVKVGGDDSWDTMQTVMAALTGWHACIAGHDVEILGTSDTGLRVRRLDTNDIYTIPATTNLEVTTL